ncbi:MAG: hypothetical protein OEU32_00900, partial [Acidimicrobiia bacterium]|nr:hypothetical protein [Acidimicrobiia bacterium]
AADDGAADDVAADDGAADDGAADDGAADDGAADDGAADDGAADDGAADDGAIVALDANGDGEVRIGVAAQGPRDDGGYYEAMIAQAEELSAANGFGEVIVVDEITFEEAAVELDNLANQPVDIILVGASGVAGPLPELSEQYPDIYWYCNCGAGFEASPNYSQTQDEGAGIHYTAGVAFGLALQEAGGDTLAMLGCCDLGFEKEAFLATQLGLQSVDPAFTITYTPTGDFPFDFDNVPNATAAYDAAVAAGADAIYPFLGGALEPVAQLAIDAGLIVANPGSSSACGGDIPYDLAVRFDGGDYVRIVFPDIVAGSFPEGDVKVFTVATDPDVVGAELCGVERPAELQAAFDLVASGDLDADIGAIKAEAFSGG